MCIVHFVWLTVNVHNVHCSKHVAQCSLLSVDLHNVRVHKRAVLNTLGVQCALSNVDVHSVDVHNNVHNKEQKSVERTLYVQCSCCTLLMCKVLMCSLSEREVECTLYV